MDKLKENGFIITVALLAVGLVALLYFMILQPYLDNSGAETLSGAKSALAKLADKEKTPQFPTKKLEKDMNDRQERLKTALDDAKQFYDNKKSAFDVFFAGEDQAALLADANGFGAKYQTQLEALQKAYKDAFPEAVPTQEEIDAGAKALLVDSNTVFTTEADIIKGMKSYWVIEEIFNAATKLQIGGIKTLEIKDPLTKASGGRNKEDLIEIPDHFGVIRALVTIEMPMSKVNDLLGELQRSAKVPFIVHKIKSSRIESQLKEKLVEVKDYADGEFPKEKADREGHPGAEPDMQVALELWALDWKGLKEEGKGSTKKGRGKKGRDD